MADNIASIFSGGQSGQEKRNWFVDAADSWLIESQVDNAFGQIGGAFFGENQGFNPYEDDYLSGFEQYYRDFAGVRSKEEADSIKRTIQSNNARREALGKSGRWFAPMMGAIAAPENLALAVFVPGAGTGSSILRGAVKAGAYIGASELAMEVGYRRPLDPSRTPMETYATVGGGALLGGAFSAALRGAAAGGGMVLQGRKMHQLLKENEADLNTEMIGLSETPDMLHIAPDEGLHQRLASTSGNTNIRIIRNDESMTTVRNGSRFSALASYIDGAGQRNGFRRTFKQLLDSGRVSEEDPLTVAYRQAQRSKRKNAFNEFFDIAAERIAAANDTGIIYGIKPEARTPELLEGLDRALDTPALRQQDSIFGGRIQFNDEKIVASYRRWVKEGGRVANFPKQKGTKSLEEFGLKDGDIRTVEDFREFVLRHELWHQSTRDDVAPSGRKMSREKMLADEDAVNEKAVEDYLSYRKRNTDIVRTEFKSRAMKWADGVLGGRLVRGADNFADWAQFRLSNNPMAVVMRRAKTVGTQDEVLRLTGDQSINSQAQMAGHGVPSSVQTGARIHEGRAAEALNDIYRAFNEYLGQPADSGKFLYVHTRPLMKRAKFTEFSEEVGRARMMGAGHPNAAVAKAMKAVDEYYAWSKAEMDQAGILRMQESDGVLAAIREIEWDINAMKPRLRKMMDQDENMANLEVEEVINWDPTVLDRNTNPGQKWHNIRRFRKRYGENDNIFEQLDFLTKRHWVLTKDSEYMEQVSDKVTEEYFTRQYNTRAVRAYRQEFEDMITQSFLDNPKVWLDGKGWVMTDPSSARERAQRFISELLHEVAEEEPRFSATPGSLKRRKIPLRNRDLINFKTKSGQTVDFIHVDPAASIMPYARRMGAHVEFSKRYRPEKRYMNADEQFERQLNLRKEEELKAGNDPKTVQKMMRDLRYLKDAVTHKAAVASDHWSREAVQFAKNLTHLSTMGGSGLVAANELASIHLTQGMGRIWRHMQALNDDGMRAWMAKNNFDLQRMGVYLEAARGVTDVRFNDSIFDPENMSRASTHLQRATNGMFMVNMMGPITMKLKAMQGTIVIDRTLRGIADAYGLNGIKSADDVKYLKQMGIPKAVQKRIADQLKENWDDIYDPESDLFAVDTRQWRDQGAARSFQEHVLADIENTIILANTSTKWKVMDGVLHIPKNNLTSKILDKYDFKLDEGYYRVEHPAISLPFMYISWPLAAANKVMARSVRSEYAAPFGFLASSVAISYMIQEFKAHTQGRPRDFLSTQDKLLNAIMMSNSANILTDYWERGGYITAAVARDMGYDMSEDGNIDVRIPHRRFLDIQTPLKAVADELVGPAISKPVDAIGNALNPNRDGLGESFRMLPFQNMPGFAMFISWIRDATEGALGYD